MLVMRPMQAQQTPLEFVSQEHTDFFFEVSNWPAFLATIGTIALALGLLVHWYWRRRRTRDEP
jgi:hypothetical protein